MPADEISVLIEMLLLTNRPNFSPAESWRSEVAMSGKTTDFLANVVKKVTGVRRWAGSFACGAGDGGCWARAAVALAKLHPSRVPEGVPLSKDLDVTGL